MVGCLRALLRPRADHALLFTALVLALPCLLVISTNVEDARVADTLNGLMQYYYDEASGSPEAATWVGVMSANG